VDRRGYGVTLATVNVLGVLCCIFQVGIVACESPMSRHVVVSDCTCPLVQPLHMSCALPAHASMCCAFACDQFDLFEAQCAPRMQAIPNLPAQALTLASWCASRVILYSSFYAIVGANFSMRTFGSIIGAISTVTVTHPNI
jgi:hypothetical protein